MKSQCQSYKSRSEKTVPCPHQAKHGSSFCGIHRNGHPLQLQRGLLPPSTSGGTASSLTPPSNPSQEGGSWGGGAPPPQTIQQMLSKDPTRTVWSAVLEQNRHNKQLVVEIMNHRLQKSDFKKMASERNEGQWAWGMTSFNIRHSQYLCKNACFYCYIGPMFKRFGRVCQPVPIEEMMPVDPKAVKKSWTPVHDSGRRQMVFFPSSSDIFVENAKDYVQVCLKILHAGHEVMFVTKPTLCSIQAILHEMEETGEMDLFRSKMAIFITNTTNDPQLLKQMEPHASTYAERLEVIIELRRQRFHVNVMMEPYLSDPRPMIREVEGLLDSSDPDWVIAIGKLNYSGQMLLNPDPEVDRTIKAQLTQLYAPDNLRQLWEVVQSDPHLFLKKDSNKALLKLCGVVAPRGQV